MESPTAEAVMRSAPRPGATGRFAPSPTGRMHLGNVYAALMSYLSAKRQGGRWLLRIEDIDTQRSRQTYADWIMDDLQWLGLAWDDTPVFQSRRNSVYDDCLARLWNMGLLYPCCCTRSEIMATQAPHESDGHVVYSGKCRPHSVVLPSSEEPPHGETLRLMVPPLSFDVQRNPPCPAERIQHFVDKIHGAQAIDLATHCGDFVVRRRDGAWSYQLAVAVDDALLGVTEVVRGDDLLLSTAPQRYLASLLALPRPCAYIHLPLLCNEDGQRLSKRDRSLSMEWMREHSTPHDIVAHVCRLAGINPDEALAFTKS